MNKEIEEYEEKFFIDPQILSSCFELGNWPLCRVLLKNNAEYPWLILVPRINGVQEVDDLPKESRYKLIDEIIKLSSIIRIYFKPDKLNVAYLGNIVPQLHVHVVARFTHDKLWPHSIWQASQGNTSYAGHVLIPLLDDLRIQINA